MKPKRLCTLLVFLYVTFDFVDPSLPGVFFFGSQTLFVDGAVQGQAGGSNQGRPASDPATTVQNDPGIDSRLSMPAVSLVRLSIVRRTLRSHMKHDDPTSPAPPSSEEDH